jgi:DNA recombination protein RmuC
VLRDVRLRDEAQALQAALRTLLVELDRLAGRVGNLQRHFAQATDDLRQIEVSCSKAMAAGAHLDLDRLASPDPTTGPPAPTAG